MFSMIHRFCIAVPKVLYIGTPELECVLVAELECVLVAFVDEHASAGSEHRDLHLPAPEKVSIAIDL